MQQRLSRGQQKRIHYIMSTLESVTYLASKVDEDTITDLVQRAAIPSRADGLPSNTRLGERGSNSGSETSSTEGAVFARNPEFDNQPQRSQQDPIQRQLHKVEKWVGDAEASLKAIVASIEYTGAKLEEKRQRPTSVPCPICHELPVEKGGYCSPDYYKFVDYGRPDRLLWEMYQRQDRDATGALRVPDCPPPTKGNTARRGPHRSSANVGD